MHKYTGADIVFAEVPDETTLAINLSNCPHRCKGCHSSYLQTDTGKLLDTLELCILLNKYKGLITCVSLMGGDSDIIEINNLAHFIKCFYKLKVAWYSGFDSLPKEIDLTWFDYIKLGHYDEEKGPLNSETTNQFMWMKVTEETVRNITYNKHLIPKGWIDITYKFNKHGKQS